MISLHFEQALFAKLIWLFDCSEIRTTPYDPQTNAMLERSYRALKAGFIYHFWHRKARKEDL